MIYIAPIVILLVIRFIEIRPRILQNEIDLHVCSSQI